jgi:rhodanese-related sulfurtransferase
LYDQARKHPAGYRETGPEQIMETLGSARIIDVREPFEFATGRVPSSELVPLDQFAAASASWNKDALYVLVCRSGARSGRAAGYLASQGFTRVINMAGGMMEYAGLGLDLETAA